MRFENYKNACVGIHVSIIKKIIYIFVYSFVRKLNNIYGALLDDYFLIKEYKCLFKKIRIFKGW